MILVITESQAQVSMPEPEPASLQMLEPPISSSLLLSRRAGPDLTGGRLSQRVRFAGQRRLIVTITIFNGCTSGRSLPKVGLVRTMNAYDARS